MATADNAGLLALSGARSPYQGTLGVIHEGALADLRLVDGDPVANISLLENPAKNLLVIVKDGKVFKNILSSSRLDCDDHIRIQLTTCGAFCLVSPQFKIGGYLAGRATFRRLGVTLLGVVD